MISLQIHLTNRWDPNNLGRSGPGSNSNKKLRVVREKSGRSVLAARHDDIEGSPLLRWCLTFPQGIQSMHSKSNQPEKNKVPYYNIKDSRSNGGISNLLVYYGDLLILLNQMLGKGIGRDIRHICL